jgi:hypothetical protein
MNESRWNPVVSWMVTAALGAIWAVYFLEPTRYAALTQTAGWFLKAARFLAGGGA